MTLVEILQNLFKNTDVLTISVTFLVAAIGWIVALLLQNRNIKQHLKVQIKYDIYKQLVQIHKTAQDNIGKLGARMSPPLALMRTSMIPYNLKLKKEHKGQWISYNEQECLMEGHKEWRRFVQRALESYSNFSDNYVELLYLSEDWEGAFKSLLKVKKEFQDEISRLKNEIHEQLTNLQIYSSNHGHDWRKWNEDEVRKITNSINEKTFTIGSYLSDFMVLVYNETLSSYFGHSRETRKTLDPDFKILTKEGIVTNIDTGLKKKSEKWREEIVTTAKIDIEENKNRFVSTDKSFLVDISKGVCPECKIPLLIWDTKEKKDGRIFSVGCGHNLEISL